MKTELFDELKGSLQEMVEHASGRRSDLPATSRSPEKLPQDDITPLGLRQSRRRSAKKVEESSETAP